MAPGPARALTFRYAALIGLLELAIAVPMPVLVLHMTGRGLDLATIGFVFAIRALLVVVLELPTGGLADAIGRRPVALASQLFTLVSFALLLFLTGPTIALAYALFQGIGAALHSGAMDAWYVDELKRLDSEAPLQPHLATVEVFQAGGLLFGTLVGGLLPSLTASLDLAWPLSAFGIALFAGVCLRAVCWLVTLWLMREPVKPQGRVASIGEVPSILKDTLHLARVIPSMRWLLLAAAASGLAMVSLETFWQPIAATVFGSEAANSQPYAVLGTVGGIAVLLGSLAVLRWGMVFPGGAAALAGFSTLVRGAALVLFAIASSAGGFGIAMALAFFALAASNVPHDSILHKVVPTARRSSMLSVQSMVFYIGIAIAAGPLGWVATQLGPRSSLLIAGCLTAVSFLAYVAVARTTSVAPPAASQHPTVGE